MSIIWEKMTKGVTNNLGNDSDMGSESIQIHGVRRTAVKVDRPICENTPQE
jgi:hypothetical protein